jgi:hypothetical protein
MVDRKNFIFYTLTINLMLKKLSRLSLMIVLLGVIACVDNELVSPQDRENNPDKFKNGSGSLLLTTRTIYIHGKTEMTPELADVYYRINGNSWVNLGTMNTSCQSMGSFQANDGDIINIAIVETATMDPVSFWVREQSASCPTRGTAYCSDPAGIVDYSHQVFMSMTISVTGRINGDDLMNCYY